MIAVQHDAVALRYSIRMIRLCVLHMIQTLQKKTAHTRGVQYSILSMMAVVVTYQLQTQWQCSTHAYNFVRNQCSITTNLTKL